MSPAMACVPGARRRRSSSRSCSNARIVPAARQLGPALVLLLWLLAQALWAPAAVAGGIETGSGIEPWGQTKGSGAADVVPSPPPLSQQRPRLRVSNKGSNSNTGRPLLVTGLLALAALLLPPLLARACRWLLAAFPALGRLRGDRPLGGLRFRWADYSMRAPLLLMDEEEEDEEEEEGASEDGRLEEGALGLVMPLGLEAGGDGSEGETTDEEEEKRLVLEEEAALTRVRRQQRRLLQRREWYSSGGRKEAGVVRNYPSAWPPNQAHGRGANPELEQEEDLRLLLCGAMVPSPYDMQGRPPPDDEAAAVAAFEAAALDAALEAEKGILGRREARRARRQLRRRRIAAERQARERRLMGGGDRDLEEDGDEEWERQRRRDSRLSLAWHRRALAAVWRAWETPSGSGAAAAADGVSSPSPSLFPLPLDRSPLPPSPSSNAAPAPLGAWPWFYPRGEELRRLRREQEASRAAERARVQQQQQQQRQKQQMLRGVAAGAGGGVPGCHGKGRAATGGGGGPFAPYHRYHHRPSSSSSINQLALLTGFGTGTGKREMMGLSELRKAIRANVLRAHKGVRRRWRAELMARFGAEAKASGEEGEHRRVEKLLPPPSVVVRGGEEEGDGGEGLQQQLQGGLLALFLDGPEDEGKGEEAIPYAPETYMDDDEEDWADGYGGWWGGKGKGKGGKRGKRQRQMMMDPHCFNPRSLLPGARGPAFGSGFGGHGRGGGESSGSSSSELITQLAKADNGRIVFEGRNFSKYEITSTTRLGGGHFGTIFAVREMQTGRECVVKLYKRSQRDAALDVAHEKNFLIMARRCQCPYLIDYVDDLLDLRRGCYMVLSPVCRETMEQRLDGIRHQGERDYGFRTYVKWLSQIAEGLRALHEMKIIHCDLALRNILLTREDEIRLSDFGVAVTALAGGVSAKEAMKGLSFSLAPEMRHAHGSNGGPRNRFGLAADCWSFGVAAYLMGCKETALVADPHASPWQMPTEISDPNVASLARSMCPHLYRGDLRCRAILLAEQASQERAAGPEREGKEEEGAVDADLLLRLPATQEQQLQPQQPQPSPSLPDVADTQAQVQQGEGGVLLFQRPRGGVHGSGGTAAEEWRRLLLELRREEEGVGDGHAKGEDAMVGEDGGDGGGQELLQAPPLADDPPPQESQQPPSAGRRVVGPIARVVVRLLQREPADRMDSAAAAEAVEGIRRRYLEYVAEKEKAREARRLRRSRKGAAGAAAGAGSKPPSKPRPRRQQRRQSPAASAPTTAADTRSVPSASPRPSTTPTPVQPMASTTAAAAAAATQDLHAMAQSSVDACPPPPMMPLPPPIAPALAVAVPAPSAATAAAVAAAVYSDSEDDNDEGGEEEGWEGAMDADEEFFYRMYEQEQRHQPSSPRAAAGGGGGVKGLRGALLDGGR